MHHVQIRQDRGPSKNKKGPVEDRALKTASSGKNLEACPQRELNEPPLVRDPRR